jgi:hypothetical protein
MKILAYTLFISVLLAGCALTTLNTKNDVKQPEAENATAANTDVTAPVIAAPDQDDKATENAVVDAGNTLPRSMEPAVNVDFQNGLALHEEGRLRDARVSLTNALNNNLGADDEAKALELLRGINAQIFLTADEGGDLQVYKVKNGDTLGKIAENHGTTWEMIQRLNELTSTRINVGQELKILGGKFELVVRKEKFVMDLMLDGAFVQRYEVGLGLAGCTPLGEFTVKNRISKPADGSWPFGHEKHRLGSRWLGLKGDPSLKGYGIHGCRADEESEIGTECSQGCVRLRNVDVEEIYDIVPVNTRVVIQQR